MRSTRNELWWWWRGQFGENGLNVILRPCNREGFVGQVLPRNQLPSVVSQEFLHTFLGGRRETGQKRGEPVMRKYIYSCSKKKTMYRLSNSCNKCSVAVLHLEQCVGEVFPYALSWTTSERPYFIPVTHVPEIQGVHIQSEGSKVQCSPPTLVAKYMYWSGLCTDPCQSKHLKMHKLRQKYYLIWSNN